MIEKEQFKTKVEIELLQRDETLKKSFAYFTDKEGEEAVEESFHITNAPYELLTPYQLGIASAYRGARLRSVSVDDVVSANGVRYICESIGWKQL